MPELIKAIEIFATVTGVLYVFLEIKQKNTMWLVGILTSAACAFSFAVQQVWASMGLNIYYVGMSVWGFLQWKKAGTQVAAGEIHLRRPTVKEMAISSALTFILILIMVPILRATGDPSPSLDAVAVSLSVIGTWWLAQSFLHQWLIWVEADIIFTCLCISVGQYWMAALYLAYCGAAVYGYFHWKKRGKYVNSQE